jgi:spectinomycin phosphotransferase
VRDDPAVQQPPPGFDATLLRPAAARFGVDAAVVRYAAVGFGDHHWTADDGSGGRWFLTVSDLIDKPHCGAEPLAALHGLRAAMDTAAELAERLPFVVAPLRTPAGETVVALDGRWALAAFPFLVAEPGPVDPAAVLDLLADLHRTAVPGAAPTIPVQPAGRADLDVALNDSARPWAGGPYAESARAVLRERAAALRAALAAFDADVPPWDTVLTHGEPHPDNLLRTAAALRLLDWDTVGRAPAERDLWHVLEPVPLAERGPLLDRYARRAGRRPDPRGIAWWARRWDVDEVGLYLAWFRAPHTRSPDSEIAWQALRESLDRLAPPGL